MKNLNTFYNVSSICLIGASDKENSIGYTISKNLSFFKKDVFYVNPRLSGKYIFNKKVFSSILDINKQIDIVIIAISHNLILDVIKDISKTTCKNIILISSGFLEIGNKQLSLDLKNILDKNKINLLGPNCLGYVDLYNNLNASFISSEVKFPQKGNVSLISQSGALGLSFLDRANFENIGVSKFFSYGNSLDISESDLLLSLENEKNTKIILCYIEGIKDGNLFLKTLKKVSKSKKIIILKGGISNKGIVAATSHTAAIAGSFDVFKSACKQSGAYLVNSISEMFSLAKVFSNYDYLDLSNIQIITNGGGFGVLTSDQLDFNGFNLPSISKKSFEKIKKIVPSYAVIKNPLDLTGDCDNFRFIKTINICLNDKNISCLILLFLFQLSTINQDILIEIINIRKKSKKPIFVLAIGGFQTNIFLETLEKNNVICFKDPKDLSDILKFI
ncbi:MAG: CoA-binding protein [Candidatus ainarchaeum sp.]|nr:CoA-binding protein [Candidatus ainarchaeum sp.]